MKTLAEKYQDKLTKIVTDFSKYFIDDHTYNRLAVELNLYRVGINGKTYICYDEKESTPDMCGMEQLTDYFGFTIKFGEKLFKPVIAKTNK